MQGIKDELFDSYAAAMIEEFESLFGEISPLKVLTLYAGGGTPNYFGAKRISSLIEKFKKRIDFSSLIEATVEVNPEGFDDNTAKIFKDCGFDRISIGVQSFNERELQILGRSHGLKEIYSSVQAAKDNKFDRIGIDLIYGIPGQNEDDFCNSLELAISLGIDSVSCYALTVSKSSPFADHIEKGLFSLSSEEEYVKLYFLACDVLKNAKFEHYEVSNWAKPGCESVHNMCYWQRKPYVSLGAGASSFLSPIRFTNADDPLGYAKGGGFLYETEIVSKESKALEEIYLSLRTNVGIKAKTLKKYAEDSSKFKQTLEKLEKEGLLISEGDRIFASKKGWLVLDRIVVEVGSS